MNARERLLAVLDGQPTDRVPISTYELVGYNSAAFENRQPSYQTLMDVIRRDTDCICMWNPASNEAYGLSSVAVPVDIQTEVGDRFIKTQRTLHTPKKSLTATGQVQHSVHTTWQTEHFCKTSGDVDAWLSIPYQPVQYDFSDFARIQSEVGEHGIIMASLADPVCIAMELMEFGEATIWALTETEHFARTIQELHERTMQNLKNMLDAGVVDLYRICGPEYLTPPYLPPVFFERFVVPSVTAMVSLIHAYGSKARVHCHGRIGRVLDAIRSTGADGIDPCEAPPDGDIDLADIKRRVGGSMTIFGNLQLKMLERSSPDEVRAYVRSCMQSAKAGGRYVIMPTAAPINIPLAAQTEENYKVFIETARTEGRY